VKDNQIFPFSDILEDIREECQKYGPVVSLLIPKENPGKGQVSEWREEAVCCRAAAQLLEISWLMTVLKIAGYLEGQHRFLPGYVRLPDLGGPQTAFSGESGCRREGQKPVGGRGGTEDVEHRCMFSHLIKHAALRNEEQEVKFQFRGAAPSILAPLLWAQPSVEGRTLSGSCFSWLQGWEGVGGKLHWKSYISCLSFRSLLNMQMLVIPKLPKKC